MFYTKNINNGIALLDEEESRHLQTVLRHKTGDLLQMTNGAGIIYTGEISEIGKRQVLVRILKQIEVPHTRNARLHVAIAPTKNIDRFEWFLEKATEIGVDIVTPLLCKRSERDSIRADRLEKILISAMKQSLRAYLPELRPLTPLAQVLGEAALYPQRFIAWCPETPPPHLKTLHQAGLDTLVLIGPEGDFTTEEVDMALGNGFSAVSLGAARLRTETAGLYVVAGLNW
ncbi:MAG: 16S rRNA (uracil(1498)-N(3))-methyltransferase [Bacteroidetes bacterium]|nr:16S rRNA (uracil(1498)-N(3))-methyltransferase [Bacteroidota bacterium]